MEGEGKNYQSTSEFRVNEDSVPDEFTTSQNHIATDEKKTELKRFKNYDSRFDVKGNMDRDVKKLQQIIDVAFNNS